MNGVPTVNRYRSGEILRVHVPAQQQLCVKKELGGNSGLTVQPGGLRGFKSRFLQRPRRAGNVVKAPLGPFYFTVWEDWTWVFRRSSSLFCIRCLWG